MILIRRSSVRFDESHGRPKTAAGSTVSNRIVDRATAPRITTKNVHDDTVFQMSRLPEDCHQDQDKKSSFSYRFLQRAGTERPSGRRIHSAALDTPACVRTTLCPLCTTSLNSQIQRECDSSDRFRDIATHAHAQPAAQQHAAQASMRLEASDVAAGAGTLCNALLTRAERKCCFLVPNASTITGGTCG